MRPTHSGNFFDPSTNEGSRAHRGGFRPRASSRSPSRGSCARGRMVPCRSRCRLSSPTLNAPPPADAAHPQAWRGQAPRGGTAARNLRRLTTCQGPEFARSFLRLMPVDTLVTEPAPLPPRGKEDMVSLNLHHATMETGGGGRGWEVSAHWKKPESGRIFPTALTSFASKAV